MTEKRFVNKGKDIFQYGEWWCSANGEHCADVIATAINELIEENEQLKQTVSDWSGSYDELFEDVKRLEEENEKLKAQLYCDSDEGVCIICKHHYLEKRNLFYISKCEKGHEECSKDALKHCKDFEIKELQE